MAPRFLAPESLKVGVQGFCGVGALKVRASRQRASGLEFRAMGFRVEGLGLQIGDVQLRA